MVDCQAAMEFCSKMEQRKREEGRNSGCDVKSMLGTQFDGTGRKSDTGKEGTS